MMSRPDRNSTRHTTSTRVGHVIAESATYAQVLNDIDLPLCARHGQYVGAFDLVGGGQSLWVYDTTADEVVRRTYAAADFRALILAGIAAGTFRPLTRS